MQLVNYKLQFYVTQFVWLLIVVIMPLYVPKTFTHNYYIYVPLNKFIFKRTHQLFIQAWDQYLKYLYLNKLFKVFVFLIEAILQRCHPDYKSIQTLGIVNDVNGLYKRIMTLKYGFNVVHKFVITRPACAIPIYKPTPSGLWSSGSCLYIPG